MQHFHHELPFQSDKNVFLKDNDYRLIICPIDLQLMLFALGKLTADDR